MHLINETYWKVDRENNTVSINASKQAYEQMDVEKAKEVRDMLSEVIQEVENQQRSD
ncbi:hypothetical protein [Halogeometricum pallidum]|uniref:hypothetical protein n=1 Tax=Halogeometricum pallidum TaxID=411361 RepID=UPI001360B4FD|nr:hypothetical protein [Halogeometricum pallidum]